MREVKPRRKRKRKEELLELTWTLGEREKGDLSSLLDASRDRDAEELFYGMQDEGLVEIEEGKVRLTSEGKEIARNVIRRHRLAEVLLTEILEASDESAHSQACEFEHILNPEITDSICTLLGHPPACPHGKSIPPGECCKKFRREVEPLVVPLDELEIGSDARVVFMTPREHTTLDKLSIMGLVPGRKIRLHQKTPALVVRVGETDLALDQKTARSIFVKRA